MILAGRLALSHVRLSLPPARSLSRSLAYNCRHFSSSCSRRDVLFVSIPVVKSIALEITRMSLVTLPFLYRYRLFHRFPKAFRYFLSLPLYAFAVIVALGISQSPTTHRWRLCLMSEREEMAWSEKRFVHLMEEDKHSVIASTDPRAAFIKQVAEPLIATLATQNDHIVIRPGQSAILRNAHPSIEPTVKISPGSLPFRPPTSNPEKIIAPQDWQIFLIDKDDLNATVLPTKEIIITSSLIDFLDNDKDMLSAVLAHELSHVEERHAVENLGFLALSSVAFDILRGVTYAFTISFPYLTDGMSAVFNFMDRHVTERAYSRKLEIEADTLSLFVLAKAGIDPTKALQLWERLTHLERQERDAHARDSHRPLFDMLPIARTHPPAEQRLKNIEEKLPAALDEYRTVLIERKKEAKSLQQMDN